MNVIKNGSLLLLPTHIYITQKAQNHVIKTKLQECKFKVLQLMIKSDIRTFIVMIYLFLIKLDDIPEVQKYSIRPNFTQI